MPWLLGRLLTPPPLQHTPTLTPTPPPQTHFSFAVAPPPTPSCHGVAGPWAGDGEAVGPGLLKASRLRVSGARNLGGGLALLPSFHHVPLSSETTAGSFPGPGLWCQPPCCAAHPGQAATPQQRAEGPFEGTAQRLSPTPTPPGAPHPPGPVAQGLAQPIRSLGPPRQRPSQDPGQASPCPSLACELVRPTFSLEGFPPA